MSCPVGPIYTLLSAQLTLHFLLNTKPIDKDIIEAHHLFHYLANPSRPQNVKYVII